MTKNIDFDLHMKNISLPFDSDEMVKMGLRIRPAEFARILGCTKQAVSVWVRDGKILLGTDGRLDPRQAVAQLLKNSDPSRLRARVLQPLINELSVCNEQIRKMKQDLNLLTENLEFSEGLSEELSNSMRVMRDQLIREWPELQSLPMEVAKNAWLDWVDHVTEYGVDNLTLSICDFIPLDSEAPEDEKEG